MVNSIVTTSSRDILYTSATDRSKIGTTSDALKDAFGNITEGQRFADRASLDASGLAGRFDVAQATLLKVEANKSTTSIVKGKLDTQRKAMRDVNDVMVRFEQEMANESVAAGTKAEKANRALARLETILRSRNLNGEYIFGGTDLFTDPLSKIDPVTGNRVASNITTQTNVVNGNVLVNNYSDIGEDATVVTLSSKHETRRNLLFPGSDAIVKTIGYLNMVKEGTQPVDQIAVAQLAQKNARGTLEVQIGYEIEEAGKAEITNLTDINSASDVLKEFKGDINVLTNNAKDLLSSLLAQTSIAAAGDRAFDTLVNNLK
ncbi:MAG: hypothetical protein J0L79_03475 [Rickettsiales bacterium]|nr:hypothetical protein [Rickettsiales bacterium]